MLPPGAQRFLLIEGTHKALPIWAIAFAIPLLVFPRLAVARGWKREMEWLIALLAELLDFEGGTWEFKVHGPDVRVLRSPALPEKDDERNRRLMLWFHRLTEQKLLPLHALHPIKCVSFVRY